MCWSFFKTFGCFFDRILSCFCHTFDCFQHVVSLWFESFHKRTSVTAQQLALWLLTDMLFPLFWGAYVFWWVLLFQNSAVIHKVAQCVIRMQIRYISYIFHPPYQDWTIAHGHLRTNHNHSFFTPVWSARNQNTSKKLAHCYTQNTINSKHPSQKHSIISTYHYLQLQKILPDRFPVKHSVQN